MSRRVLMALVPVLVAIGGPTAWAQRPFPTDLLPTQANVSRLGLERQWYSVVPLAGVDDRVLDFTVDQGVFVVHTSGGYIHTFDAETGRYFWGASIGHKTAKAFPASVNSNQIFVTSLNELIGFDRATGRKLFDVDLENLPATGTGCDEELAMVGLRSGKLVAFNTRDHSTDGTPRGQAAGSFAFAWQTKGMLTARPLVAEKLIAFGSADHRVYVALKARTGGVIGGSTKLLFRYLTAGPISANLAAYGNRTLVIPSGDNNVYAVDLLNATTRWSVATGAPVDQEPLVFRQDVFVINAEGRVLNIDALTGELKWSTPTGCKVLLAVTPSRLYLRTATNELVILDRANGKVVASARDTLERAGLNLRPFVLSFPNYYDDRLYYSTPNGLIICLREIGRTKPTTLRDPTLAPFGTIPKEGLLTETEEPIYLTPSGELKYESKPPSEDENQEVPAPANADPFAQDKNADPFAQDNAAPAFP
ncbi:MAG TPA: PQQ-binding-like beta-propeller repeat protein [Isosphaeraceae bacterium]|nr:PQQ-binding-like beta-propeller repeat protein [Isosphaeraceae bacterium]